MCNPAQARQKAAEAPERSWSFKFLKCILVQIHTSPTSLIFLHIPCTLIVFAVLALT